MVTKVSGESIKDDTITTDNIATDGVGAAEIAAGAVGSSEIGTDAVGADEIAASAVGTAEVADGTLARADLAADARSDYIEVRDEKAAGTDGGTFTSGAWQTRDLNTEAADAGGHASVATNQITLAAGTYEAEIFCPAGVVNNHQAKLYNVTDAADTLIGTSMYCGSGSTQFTQSVVTGRFTIAAQKVFEVRHRCETTAATTGYGDACNFGVVEVYTVARFWKVG